MYTNKNSFKLIYALCRRYSCLVSFCCYRTVFLYKLLYSICILTEAPTTTATIVYTATYNNTGAYRLARAKLILQNDKCTSNSFVSFCHAYANIVRSYHNYLHIGSITHTAKCKLVFRWRNRMWLRILCLQKI